MYFVAEQVGVPPLYEELYSYSNGPTVDDHAYHEFHGLRVATDSEVNSLPIWGTVLELIKRFKRERGAWDCRLTPHCF